MSRATPSAASAWPAGAVSAIVPVLDEEARIRRCLENLAALSGIGEVVVVDGGSRDATVAIARAVVDARGGVAGAPSPEATGAATSAARGAAVTPAVRVVHARRGRGTQMNAGARLAVGDVLLFVHADATLPSDATLWIGRALAKPDVVAGGFRIRTVADGGRSWVRPWLRLADLRSRRTALPYGDQAVFVRRDAFERAGGFPEQPLMEDIELALRLRRLGRIEIVPAIVEVSGRRFLARPIASLVAMRLFPLLYRLGVPPRLLARLYGAPR